MLRIAPAKLLGDLESQRLRAFGVVRAEVDVHESPAVPVCHLRAQPVHIVVVARDRQDGWIEDRGSEELPRFEVVGNEDATFDAEPRRMRRDAVREVAGRSAGEHVEPELHRPRRRHRDDTILVRERRMVD
jgi:hypothetical protein